MNRIEPIKQLIATLPRKDRVALLQAMTGEGRASNESRPDRYLTPADAARYVGLSTKTLDRYERAGLLRADRVGKRVKRYRLSDLEKLLAGEAS